MNLKCQIWPLILLLAFNRPILASYIPWEYYHEELPNEHQPDLSVPLDWFYVNYSRTDNTAGGVYLVGRIEDTEIYEFRDRGAGVTYTSLVIFHSPTSGELPFYFLTNLPPLTPNKTYPLFIWDSQFRPENNSSLIIPETASIILFAIGSLILTKRQ